MKPRRALGALAAISATALLATGCLGGGDDASADLPPAATAPAAIAAPVAVAPTAPGGMVSAGPETPAPVARALAGTRVVVVAFLVNGPADDSNVAAALRSVRGDRGMAATTDFFVYRVGRDDFGDLADRLGVTGTPSVAVIGRDRVLLNMWDGLTDAEILRQSISDAADTAAANRGAAADVASARPVAGDPRGIALAESANAAYADVAGVRVKGTFSRPGSGAMSIDATLRLGATGVEAMNGTFSMAGARFETVATSSATSIRSEGATCWARLPAAAAAQASAPEPTVALPAGSRVSAPRKEGAADLVDVTSAGATATFVIDRASAELREVRTPEGTLTFTALDTAPATVSATPVCDDPADALAGLPGTLGGDS